MSKERREDIQLVLVLLGLWVVLMFANVACMYV